MRRYHDPVEVQRVRPDVRDGQAGEPGTQAGSGDAIPQQLRDGSPDQFLWRGRLWKVRAVLAHWVETGPWWLQAQQADHEGATDDQARSSSHDLLAERELWRVEAGRGRDVVGRESAGVFDLAFSWDDGCWQLVGCAD